MQFIDQVFELPVLTERHTPLEQTIQKTKEIPQLRQRKRSMFFVEQVTQAQFEQKTITIPQKQFLTAQ